MRAKKIKERIVPAEGIKGRHRVFYKPYQVERCLPCYGIKPKVGLKLAMLYPHDGFLPIEGAVPEAKFYIGKVIRISDDLVEIKFDGNPSIPVSIIGAWSHFEKFCIPWPIKRSNRSEDGETKP